MNKLNEKYSKELSRLKGSSIPEKLENLLWHIKAHFNLGLGVIEGSADDYEKLLKDDAVRKEFAKRGKIEEYNTAKSQLDKILYSEVRIDPRCRKMPLIR